MVRKVGGVLSREVLEYGVQVQQPSSRISSGWRVQRAVINCVGAYQYMGVKKYGGCHRYLIDIWQTMMYLCSRRERR